MIDLEIDGAEVLLGDCIERMKGLSDKSVQMCVTSPPYFGLRDYGVDGQIGLEETPEQFIAKLVEVFREVRRVLANDGTLWLNIGDSYASKPNGPAGAGGHKGDAPHVAVRTANARRSSGIPAGLKHKDLIGIPWMLAFALRADGWYLRQEIIWHKPNPMPESVTDRCTKSHESLFLLSKSPQYFFDHEAMREEAVGKSLHDLTGPSYKAPGQTPNTGNRKALRTAIESRHRSQIQGGQSLMAEPDGKRNRRSVWTIATRPYKGAHFAAFPPALVEPCILAGSRPGDVVLDPFNGSGTTGQVALQHGRRYVGIELNPEYVELTSARLELVIRAKALAATPSPQSDLFAA